MARGASNAGVLEGAAGVNGERARAAPALLSRPLPGARLVAQERLAGDGIEIDNEFAHAGHYRHHFYGAALYEPAVERLNCAVSPDVSPHRWDIRACGQGRPRKQRAQRAVWSETKANTVCVAAAVERGGNPPWMADFRLFRTATEGSW